MCLYMWCTHINKCVSVYCVLNIFVYVCTYVCYVHFSLHGCTVYEMDVLGVLCICILCVLLYFCIFMWGMYMCMHVCAYVHTHINLCTHFIQLCMDPREMMKQNCMDLNKNK